MKQMTIYYGSTTGTCETLASMIANALGIGSENVHNVTDMTKETLEGSDMLILGSSTWGCGDLQDDWYDGVEILKKADLAGKPVALFACGDGESYGDTFCEAMTHLKDALADSGCTFIGSVWLFVEDYATYALIPISYLVFGYVLREDRHLNMDLVFSRCPYKVKIILSLFAGVFTIFVCCFMLSESWSYMIYQLEYNVVSSGAMKITLWPLSCCIFVSLILFLIDLILFVLNRIIQLSTPVLMFLYPLTITLSLLCLGGGWFSYDRRVFIAVTIPTAAAAALDFLNALPAGGKALLGTDALLRPARSFLPLFSVGMGWVVPALAGLAVGLILCRLRPLRS